MLRGTGFFLFINNIVFYYTVAIVNSNWLMMYFIIIFKYAAINDYSPTIYTFKHIIVQ